MDPTTVLLLVALLVITVLLVFPRSAKRARLMRLLNKIPGPPSYPLVGTVVPFVMAPRNKRHYVMLDRLKEYQPILRTWIGSIPTVHIVLPEHAEVLLNNVQHLDKSYGYKFLHPWLGTGLLTSTGSKWHSHRKMITPTFHFKILDNFVEVFSEKSEILVQKLRQELTSPGFDVYPYVTRCALDIICETAMGTEVNAQEHNSQYVSAVYDMSELLMKRMTRPWLQTDWLYNLTKDGQRYFECLRVLHSFTNQVIQDRKCSRVQTGDDLQTPEDDIGKKRRVAFLDMLLEASEAGSKLTDEEIREEVDTFMFEGHDTTSAAISWALFLLGLHPRVQDKAWEELDSIFQGSDRPPTMKDLNEMKYLERVIKESLRLYPSVPFFSRNLSQDLDIGGHTIPADTAVRIHVDFLHRNPDQFPDPEVFNPDNFLPERVMERHPYAYIPFSAGPRNCIGQKFALLEEKTVLSYILRRYRLRSLQTREDVDVIAELIMKPHEGIPLVITPR